MAAKTLCSPYGMKPPPAPKLFSLTWVASTMMASTGMATFHTVMTLLTRLNRRMARKLMPVKMAIRMIVKTKPSPVVTFVVGL